VQTYVNASAFANLDFAAQAISKAETVGATVTAFVTSPATSLALATIKQATGSNQPVLGTDATSATNRQILGVPLFVSEFVAANTLWAIDGLVRGSSCVRTRLCRQTEARSSPATG
jgi:hypothetical protein